MARKIQVQILGDSSSLERAFTRSSRAGSAFNRDISRAGRGIVAISAGYRGLARSVAFASAAFVGTAGLTAGLKASLTGFDQFQESLQKSVGLAGIAQSQVAGFSKQILQLSSVVGRSPQELANAFFFIASSGIDAAHAFDVLTESAKASVAGLGDTATVADAVTSAVNAYGISALSATQATDVLTATVKEGKGEADQFAGVIGNVAALASQLGVSFDQVGAALAAQTRLGTDAETAATQLQRVFSALIKVTPQQAKAFKSVGLNADQLRATLGTRGGLLKVLDEVRKAFAGNLPELAKAFGDVRAVRGVLALVGAQADATRGIFERMAKSAGATQKAFDAVSQTTAQRFRQMRAAAEVAGISIGALFAPLAGKVASALAGAADQFTSFVDRISSSRTIQGKLNVVWSGITDAAHGAESALAAAIAKVDWNRVWAGARGIADGLQKRLDSIDWTTVGKAIGDGIAKGVAAAKGIAPQLAQRFEDAFRTIDFNKLGRAAGPGLAAALLSAFATLTDPAFWIKNWDLALSVALLAFGDGIGRIAGKFAAPFTRLMGDVLLKGLAVIERVAPRIAEELLNAGLHDAAAFGRGLSAVLRIVEDVFARVARRLGKPLTFVVKVLGLQVAIDAVANAFRRIAQIITHGLDAAFAALKIKAIKAAIDILDPFSHLPKQLGGGPFQRMKAGLERTLKDMQAQGAAGGKNVGQSIASGISAGLAIKSIVSTIQDQVRGLVNAATQAAGVGSRNTSGAGTTTAATATAPAKTAAATATAAKAAVDKGFTLPFRLQLAQAEAAATKSAADDLKIARDIRAFILKAIPHLHGEKLLGAYQELAQVNSTIADAVKAAADKVKSFTVPLALQVAQARATALGKDDGLKSILEKIKRAAEKALKSGRLGLQGQLDAWNTLGSVNDQLKNLGSKATSSFKKVNVANLFKGLGLTADQLRAARMQAAQIGKGGLVPSLASPAFSLAHGGSTIQVNSTLVMDRREVGRGVTKHQTKEPKRLPSRRG